MLDAAKLGQAAGSLKDKPAEERRIVVRIDEDAAAQLQVGGAAWAEAVKQAPDAVLVFETKAASYELPLRAVNPAALAKEMGVEAKDVVVSVKMGDAETGQAAVVQRLVSAEGGALLAPAVQFRVTASAGSRTLELERFQEYVTRTITLSDGADTTHATVAVLNEATGELSFVPARFKEENGKKTAVLKRNGNSVYAVFALQRTFADLEGHWARESVERMASKRIADGRSLTSFVPEEEVTRAEFAAFLTRSLGLLAPEEPQSAGFADVKRGEWYAGAVETAVHAKLIEGYEDGTFRPGGTISRQEMAVMIARAMAYAGSSPKPADAKAEAPLFRDQEAIAAWAADSVAAGVRAGILQGQGEGTFSPTAPATRAEAAVMLQRLLTSLEFI